eukprot:906641-Pleurochrysis_carterae.AAC.1
MPRQNQVTEGEVVIDTSLVPLKSLHILLLGSVMARCKYSDHEDAGKRAQRLSHGAVFGELEMLPLPPPQSVEAVLRSQSGVEKAVATDFTVVVKLRRAVLHKLLREMPRLARVVEANRASWVSVRSAETLGRHWFFGTLPPLCLAMLVPMWKTHVLAEGVVMSRETSHNVCMLLVDGQLTTRTRTRNDGSSGDGASGCDVEGVRIDRVSAEAVLNELGLLSGVAQLFSEELISVEVSTQSALVLSLSAAAFQAVLAAAAVGLGCEEGLLKQLVALARTKQKMLNPNFLRSLSPMPSSLRDEQAITRGRHARPLRRNICYGMVGLYRIENGLYRSTRATATAFLGRMFQASNAAASLQLVSCRLEHCILLSACPLISGID